MFLHVETPYVLLLLGFIMALLGSLVKRRNKLHVHIPFI